MNVSNTPKRTNLAWTPLMVCLVGSLLIVSDSCGDDDGVVDTETDGQLSDLEGSDVDADLNPDGVGPGQPLRALVTRPIFGDMPIDNRVFNPNFHVLHRHSWFGTDQTVLQIHHLPVTPTGQPALMVSRDSNPDDVGIMGQVVNSGTAQTASIWVGRPEMDTDADCSDVDATASIVGYSLNVHEPHWAAELDCDGESRRDIDNLTWFQFSGTVIDLLDWGYFLIEDQGGLDLYISGPMLIELDETNPTSLTTQPRMRPATEEERSRLSEATRERSRRMGAVPDPHQLPRLSARDESVR